jgi:hypothetical protein
MNHTKRGVAPPTKAEILTQIGNYVAAANAALEKCNQLDYKRCRGYAPDSKTTNLCTYHRTPNTCNVLCSKSPKGKVFSAIFVKKNELIVRRIHVLLAEALA